MKILAFTDMHSSITCLKKIQEKIKKYKPDILLCLGDFTVFEQNLEPVMEKISELGKLYLIHGNHEQDIVVQKLCKRYGITFMHEKVLTIGDVTLIGHGGGGFYGRGKLRGDKEFDNFVKGKTFTGKVVLMTHGPPADTKLDYLDWMDDHVGCTSYREFIDKHKPTLALSGHLHENFGVVQKVGKTVISNPGPEGMLFTL